MSTLGPEGQALVEAGRQALRPTATDRERVLLALQARIGGAGTTPDGSSPPPAIAKGLSWPAISAAVAGLAVVVGGILFYSAGPKETPPPAPPPVAARATPLPADTAAVNPPATPNAAVPDSPAMPTPAPAAGSARRPADRLAEEVAILSRAETELHASHFAAALRVLDEHRREFPHGRLTQERIAARIQALCALGRVSEAEAELGSLNRLSPKSPHEGQARAACAAKPAK